MFRHTEEIALRVGQRRPLHVGVLIQDVPSMRCTESEEPLDLALP